MARQPWWPNSLPEQMIRVKDIQSKIADFQTDLGLSGGEITAIQDICAAILGAQNFRDSTETTNQGVTEWRDQVFYAEPKGDAVSAAPIYTVMGAVTYTRGSVTPKPLF